MNIHIKNIRTDKPTQGAVGYNCSRYRVKRLQLLGVCDAKLGNPHPVGWCSQCGEVHERGEAIMACALDKEWLKALDKKSKDIADKHWCRKDLDLWCWCAPDPCHCSLIAIAIQHEVEAKINRRKKLI